MVTQRIFISSSKIIQAEYKLDNVASHQFVEFYIEALANLKKVLPENCEKILKDGPCKKEHIEALRPFAHCVQQITDIATLSLRDPG